MDLIQAIEVLALVTGVLYVILEILQKNGMWIVGILTGAACAWSFGVQHLWASMALNLYYVAISFWGLYRWRRDDARDPGAQIHLRRPGGRILLISAMLTVLGSAALFFLLRMLGDSAPLLDAIVSVLSAVGTWWLALSYPPQWLIWIVADLLSTALCLRTGLPWMAALYGAYAASAVYGYYHWTRPGTYVD